MVVEVSDSGFKIDLVDTNSESRVKYESVSKKKKKGGHSETLVCSIP